MVSIGELVQANLTAPPVLAFALGLLAARIGTDLRLPHAVTTLLSTYLLLAIGLKGGQALRETSLDELAVPIVATLIIGLITPLATYAALRHRQRFGVADAAAIAAHYGSVSAVTFTAATGFALAAGREAEGYLPALVAILEVCGIVVALLIAARRLGRSHGLSPGGAGVFGAMAASASYIAAPAATSVGLPDANPAMALTAALGITFPFNLAIGIPLYAEAATMIG